MENLRIEGDNLIGTPVFDEKDEFAKKIKDKWDNGFLKMASAGLDLIELSDDPAVIVQGQRRSTVTKSKLSEVSIVDIGCNDDALVLYKDGKMLNLSSDADISIIPEITPKGSNNNIDINNENMKSIALKLGLPETATENEILSKIGEIQTKVTASENLQQELSDLRKAAIAAEVDAAIKLKKFTADKREHFIALGESSGIDALKSTLELMHPAEKPSNIIVPGASAGGNGGEQKWADLSQEQRIELRKNDSETYKKLYKAEYGVEAEIEN
jgi:hypothetical protein